MSENCVILGAGLTGLGAASVAPAAVVYDQHDGPGGHVRSHEIGGVHFDEGAHICHARDPAWREQLTRHAGRIVEVSQSRVASYWHGHWLTYPVQNHLRDLPQPERNRALEELLAAQKANANRRPANYAEWVRYQYGDFLAENFYRAYTNKYWRTPMEAMDTDWLSGRLLPAQLETIIRGAHEQQEEKQSVFSSFLYPEKGGFFAFFSPFAHGIEIRTGARLVDLDLQEKRLRFADGRTVGYERLISTIPLPDLVAATRSAPASIASSARTLRHTQLLCVNMIVDRPHLSPYHWFYIYDEEFEVSRVKVMSNVTPTGCPANTTVLQTEIFRRDDEMLDAKALEKRAVEEMGRLLGFDPVRDVRVSGSTRSSHAYPIPTLGRATTVATIADWYDDQGVLTAGLYGRWKYMWSDQAFAAGREAARRAFQA